MLLRAVSLKVSFGVALQNVCSSAVFGIVSYADGRLLGDNRFQNGILPASFGTSAGGWFRSNQHCIADVLRVSNNPCEA